MSIQPEKEVRIEVTLSDQAAWHFAQFLKRATFTTYYDCAADKDEADEMIYAGEKVRQALAAAGYEPR
jgi:hypothetical protein